MSQFTHKVQKYALIHSAASEIIYHMEELYDCAEKYKEFHALQIEKAALFIQFVEDIYILPYSHDITDEHVKRMWQFVQQTHEKYVCMELSETWVGLWKTIDKYQEKINGKFLNVTAPF